MLQAGVLLGVNEATMLTKVPNLTGGRKEHLGRQLMSNYLILFLTYSLYNGIEDINPPLLSPINWKGTGPPQKL
jgi:hypothetical protein